MAPTYIFYRHSTVLSLTDLYMNLQVITLVSIHFTAFDQITIDIFGKNVLHPLK